MTAASTVKDGFDNADLREDHSAMLLEARYLQTMPYLGLYYPGCAESLWRIALVILTSALYGLLHVSGWGSRFQSPALRTCWHVATVTILIVGVGVSALVYVVRRFLGPRRTRNAKRALVGQRWTSALMIFSQLIFPLLAASAFYLVFESILQLGFLPHGVFQLPSLSIYWPHLS